MISCSPKEVCKRKYYHPKKSSSPELREEVVDEQMLAYVKDIFGIQQERISLVLDKSKVMLTLSAILLGLISTAYKVLDLPDLVLLPIACLLVTVYLIFVLYGVGGYSVPTVSSAIETTEEGRRLQAGRQYIKCESENSDRGDFIVDVFRASMRSLMAAFFMLTGVVLYAFSSDTQSVEESIQVIEMSDRTAIKLRIDGHVLHFELIPAAGSSLKPSGNLPVQSKPALHEPTQP